MKQSHSKNESTTSSSSNSSGVKSSGSRKESEGEDKDDSSSKKEALDAQCIVPNKVMLITKCPHVNRKHYAKVIVVVNCVEHVFKLLQEVWQELERMELCA